jgi:plastocyanin
MKRIGLVLAILLAACGAPDVPVAASGVDLHEFAVDPAAGVLAAGDVVLDITNSGEFSHTLVITDARGAVVGATDVLGSGDELSFTVHLEPGEYSFTCRIVGTKDDGTVVDHYEAGMEAMVRVTS